MAVSGSADRLPDSATAKYGTNGTKEYTAAYAVTVTDPLDGPKIVLAASGLPAIGDTYSFGNDADTDCDCRELTPTRVGATRLRWIVTARWSNEQESGDDQNDRNGDPTNDPTQVRKTVTVTFNQLSRAAEDAIWRSNSDGSALWGRGNNEKGDVVNTAHEPFVPAPEKTFGVMVVRHSSTHRTFNESDWAPFYHTVNSTNRTIAAYDSQGVICAINVPPLCGFLNAIDVDEIERPNGVIWYRITLEIWVEKRWGFRRKFKSVGRHARMHRGDPDGHGGTVSMSAAAPPVPFRAIIDDDGNPVRKDVPLDGDGQPLDADAIRNHANHVYMTYSIQDEIDWSPLGLALP